MSAIAALLSWISGLLLGLPGWALALIVGIGGALTAWAFYIAGVGVGILVVEIVVVVLVAVVAGYGVGRLPKDPITAVNAMDGLGIALMLVGVLGVFAGVWLAITFTLPKEPAPSTELTEVSKAISAALAAAVTAAIVKVAQEDADKWVAERVQKGFEAAYKDAAKTNEALRKALYLDADIGLTDWSRDQRFKRAEAISAAIS
jgi:hypothetical protein